MGERIGPDSMTFVLLSSTLYASHKVEEGNAIRTNGSLCSFPARVWVDPYTITTN